MNVPSTPDTETGPARQALDRAGIIPPSVASIDDVLLGLRDLDGSWELIGWAPGRCELITELAATTSEVAGGLFLRAPADAGTAVELRRRIDWLRPRPVGPRASIGLGDRLGLATPGHVQALREHPGLFPVLAQQSARELRRVGRPFADVLTQATFGAMATGWQHGFGADADHLKSMDEVREALAAGFTTITADPIHLVPSMSADAPAPEIRRAFEQIDWIALEDDERSFRGRYGAYVDTDLARITLTADALTAAAARFGPAIPYLTRVWRHLVSVFGEAPFEFEVAVDEIGHPTTAVDHVYIVTELLRLGVLPVAFAPRFVGTFEKGVDYLGDPVALEADIATHAAIARHLGPYRVSIHSGSDKFSIYDGIERATRGMFHLKTSGTSYLQALRTVAATEPALFRSVWQTAVNAYTVGRSSYIVSAHLDDAPDVASVEDAGLPDLLDSRSVREILHVTFGAILGAPPVTTVTSPPGDDAQASRGLIDTVVTHRERYWADLAAHIGRHLAPFTAP
jgi:hypothetical protein